MKVPALIMAGGKGKRMGLPVEKPLLPFLGKPLIDWIVDAAKSAKRTSEVYIVTSGNTPETEKKCLKDELRILRTDGKGYHDDLKQAILENQLRFPVLTIPADLPAITGEYIDKIVKAYEECGKDALAVFTPLKTREGMELSVSSVDQHDGVWHAVTGVNVINGAKILDAHINTDAIITEDIEVLLNINTLKDLEIAEKVMRERMKKNS